VAELVPEERLLTEAQLNNLLELVAMTQPISEVDNAVDLLAWLESQPSRVGTHTVFREAARSLAASQKEYAALLILLVTLSKRFTTFFEDVPVTVHTIDTAQQKLVEYFRLGLRGAAGRADDYLAILNEIALGNLIET
jgi:hypothetical protein